MACSFSLIRHSLLAWMRTCTLFCIIAHVSIFIANECIYVYKWWRLLRTLVSAYQYPRLHGSIRAHASTGASWHVCKTFVTYNPNKNNTPLRWLWVPVFAKQKAGTLIIGESVGPPPYPHTSKVETWLRLCLSKFQLFFRPLRALGMHTINIGRWGGEGDG